MTRLTVRIKNQIITKAITLAGIDAEFSSLIKRRAILAENIRVDSLGGKAKVKKIVDKVAEMQDSFREGKLLDKVKGANMTGYVKSPRLYAINLGGMRVNINFNGNEDYYGEAKEVYKSPVPDGYSINYAADHKFTKEFLSIEGDCDVTKGKREGIATQVRATIHQFTTIKKLLEAWPEAKDLLPSKIEESKANLPAVQVKDLNCLIGLPKDS